MKERLAETLKIKMEVLLNIALPKMIIKAYSEYSK